MLNLEAFIDSLNRRQSTDFSRLATFSSLSGQNIFLDVNHLRSIVSLLDDRIVFRDYFVHEPLPAWLVTSLFAALVDEPEFRIG